MSAHCCHHEPPPPPRQDDPAQAARARAYRRALWIALIVNATMFGVEITSGIAAGSQSLLADSLDFLGDAANYTLSLAVLGTALAVRARAAQVKALSMAAFGLLVLASAFWHALTGAPPQAATMGLIGSLALAANLGVAALLYAHRSGDANMRSVWLCTRNDALGNLAVLIAALGVFGTGSAWPDLVVAAAMALLALHSATQVLRQARGELAQAR
ncbi:MAG TPA: cation transporter [Burkholderiales bacterium]